MPSLPCGHNFHLNGPKRTQKAVPQSRVELYMLFEGCIRHTTLWELMVKKQMELPEVNEDTEEAAPKSLKVQDVISYMVFSKSMNNDEITQKLKICIDVLLDDLESLERVCMEISEDARDNGVKYFEVSLDPYKFISKDKSSSRVLDVVRTVLAGFKKAEEFTSAKAGVLLQYQKGMSEESKEILKLCQDFKEENVVGIELAGYDFNIEAIVAEDSGSLDFLLFNPDDIAIFEEAKLSKIHRSVHAGEFGPSDVIFQAIEKLGAERIVFGYSVTQDASLYHDCIINKIHLCTTPTLSCINGSVGLDRFYHPVVQFAEDNANFSINSGLPVITGGCLGQELELVKSWGLTETHLAKAVFNAARSAFLDDKSKKELQKDLRKAFGMEDKVELEIMINHNCGMSDEDGVQQKLKVSF